ncbi:MFS transporter, OCT family, solute carrier family 22 (organic cation transporter), member 4/5 [Schistosoma bovis]|uniref:MFS transporter, OCT family, solute carrier family 22 (Organic cation transporter), member 4/5 n=1 Tax=Schistosoma bovis TaxID=6184 RepID=A0A430Q4C5_SCHBO|nr:MFS transporter, OCT family, solute carrier family 22 (organic cation transporter), member 4/5 [Schistosoma bovis]
MAQCVPPTNSAQECGLRTSEIPTQQFIATKLSVDEILNKYVGEYGVWQWSIVLLIVLSSPLMVTLPVFVNAVPDHRCRMEDPIEEIFREYNLSFEEAAAFVGPWEGEIPVTMMGCLRFALDWSNTTLIENLLLNKSVVSFIDRESLKTKACVNGYVYRSKEFQYPSTVVAEFNLVCDKSMLSPLGTSLFWLECCLDSFSVVILVTNSADETVQLYSPIIELFAAFGVSLAPNHHIYHLMRTIVGFSSTGKAVPLRLLPIELTNAKYRSYFTSFIVLGIVFGHRAIMTGIAYLVREWRLLNALSTLPCLTCFIYFCLLPESPRWLLSQYRVEEAITILRRGCRINHILKKDKSKLSQFDNYLKDLNKNQSHMGKLYVHSEPISVSERFINLLKSTKKIICCRQMNKALIICVLIFTMHSLCLSGYHTI